MAYCSLQGRGLGLDCGKPPAVPPGTFKAAPDPNAAANAAKAYQDSMTAYHQALSQLNPSWLLLPTAPYPPSSDSGNDFPRTGTPQLIITASGVSAAQLAEPGKVTKGLADQALARRPAPNALFVVGIACLGAWFLVRR